MPKAAQLSREKSIGDIVVSRELWIVEAVGKDVGAWLHVGRNRAESLRGSLPRMFFRDALYREHVAMQRLVRALIDRTAPELSSLAPFYHHLQHAGRTSLGEFLLSDPICDLIEAFHVRLMLVFRTDRADEAERALVRSANSVIAIS